MTIVSEVASIRIYRSAEKIFLNSLRLRVSAVESPSLHGKGGAELGAEAVGENENRELAAGRRGQADVDLRQRRGGARRRAGVEDLRELGSHHYHRRRHKVGRRCGKRAVGLAGCARSD